MWVRVVGVRVGMRVGIALRGALLVGRRLVALAVFVVLGLVLVEAAVALRAAIRRRGAPAPSRRAVASQAG